MIIYGKSLAKGENTMRVCVCVHHGKRNDFGTGKEGKFTRPQTIEMPEN